MASELRPPDFVLRLVEGRGLLGLRTPLLLPLGRLERLELEVPNLRFPFDGSGDPSRFRNRRCTVRDAAVRIDEEQLTAWLASRPLARYGIDDLRARVAGDRLQIAGALTVGDKRAPFTCALVLRPGAPPATLSVDVVDLRTYDALPTPTPLVGLALLYAMGARPRGEQTGAPAFVLRGIDAMDLDALAVVMWRALLPFGWRLPRTNTTERSQVESDGRALILAFTSGEAVVDEVDPARAQIAAGDERLAANDLASALSVYESADTPLARRRRLATLAVIAQRRADARALGEALLEESPDDISVLVALAGVVATEDPERASELYQRASVRAERQGEPDTAIEAALRGAELLLPANAEAAIPLLERVVSGRGGHARAAGLLAACYTAHGRNADLLRLEKRRLSHARGQHEEAAARVRLGALWLDRENDPLRARDELERALRLFPGDAETFRLYARALERSGEVARAIDAAEQALAADGAEQADAPQRRADRLLAAGLAERAGRVAIAQRHVEDLLEDQPADVEGLELYARIAAAAGRLEDASSAYERAAAAVDDEAQRARLYFSLAELCLRSGARDRARAALHRAEEAQPSLEILRAAASLAEADERTNDLEAILGRLGALGDRGARARRARLLLQQGRAADAAAECEALATAGDPGALELLVEARKAEGRAELYAAALERLVEVNRDPAPRVELARLRADEGDLVRARILLEEALGVTADAPGAKDALEVLCDVLLRQGDDASLEAALGRLAALREDNAARARALGAQGAARTRLGRLDAALASYREALAFDEHDTQARLGLSEAAYVLRLWDEARAALEPVFTAQPRADRALRLGEIAERQGRPVDAITFYEAALAAGASGADAQRIYGALASLQHGRGQWEAEARVLLRAAEDARTTDNDAARASRIVHAAELLRKRAGQADEALTLYERALALEAGNLQALDALESMALEREDWARAAQVLSRKVAATAKRPAEQKAILGRLAQLQAEHLGREDAAREAYTRALAIDPSFRPALTFLAREARSAGRADEERERLERLASLPADPADPDARTLDLLRLGQLQLDAGLLDAAEATGRRVLSELPRNPAALLLLDEVYSRAGRTAELEALLAVRAQVEQGHDAAVDLLTRRAALLETLGRNADAIAAYEHVTALRPAHAASWTRLAELLRRAESWGPLANTLGRLADWHGAEGRREEAASLYVEQAHVLHNQLAQPEAARQVLERAREVWSGSRLVLGALLVLARSHGDVAEEAVLLDQLVELEPDPAARATAVLERARVLVARGERDEALRRLRELPLAAASEGALKLRIELEEQVGTVAAAADALDRLRQLAEQSGDASLERYALTRLLRIAREQTPSRAEPLATRLLALDAEDRDALRVLADAAQRRGDLATQTTALERLLTLTRRHMGDAAGEGALTVELGHAALAAGDSRAAILRFRDAIEALPNDGALRRALGLVLAKLGDDAEAVTPLSRASDLGVLTPEDQVLLADLCERTGDSRRAAAAILAAGSAASATRRAQAASRVGDEAQARAAALDALGEHRDDEAALAVLLRGLSPAAIISQLEELAPKLGVERAAAALEAWATKLPGETARMALERALVLEPTSARWLAFARRAEGEAASDAFATALALDPGSAEAALGRVAFLPPDEAIVLLASTLGVGTAAPRDRARMALRIGELHGLRGQVSAAHQAYSRALAEAEAAERIDDTARGLYLEAARALATTARADRDPREAEEALRGIIERGAANDTDQRLLAELLLERDAVADAIELLEEMPAPGGLYITALERAKQWDKLVRQLARDANTRPPAEARPLLVRASELALLHLDEPRLAASLLERAVPLGTVDADIWERIGAIRADRLEDREGAARARARAYAADSTRTHLLLELGDFHHEASEWAPARDYYHSLLQSGTVPADALPRVHLRLAEYARADADALTEEAHLRAAAAIQPTADAWRRLVQIYRVREDRFRLEQALLALADLVPPNERLPLLREARALEGPAPLAELDERILALDRNDVESRARVLDRLRHAEDPSALYDRLEREVEHALHEGGAIGPEIPIELGRVSLARKDYARAARGFRLAVESGGGTPAIEGAVEALRALGRLSEAAQLVEETLAAAPAEAERDSLERLLLALYLEVAPERALPLVEAAQRRGAPLSLDGAAHRRLLRAEGRWELLLHELDRAVAANPEDRFALQREAAEVLEGPLDRPRDAARRYAALFEANPRHRDLAARARALYIAAGELIYALAIVDQELALAEPEEAPQLKITRGELLLAAGADAEAEAEFLHALITTKRVGRAHAALADVYRKRGDLASALEHLIAAADAPDLEPARAAACAVDAADVLLIEGDTATAERLYQLAAALDPADRRALDALIRLAAAQGAYDRQAELLGRAAALTADRRERARLLHERARLFESELHRDLDAYRAYREAVACDPMLRDAVHALRMLAEARGEWAVAAEQLYREAALSEDVRERARLHVRLAQVHEEKLFDTAGAVRNLEQAGELFGDVPITEADDPWPSLIRLYAEEQRFAVAAAAAERRARLLPEDAASAVRMEALERAATLWSRSGNEQRADACRSDAARLGSRGASADTLHGDLAPEGQRQAIEARLRTEPEGATRIDLLRRLVSLLGASDNLAELDARAAELLQRAPDDAGAFMARRRVLEGARDPAALAVLLRARATATSDPRERAERRYEAGRITENQLYDPAAATIDYEAALDADPDHLSALDALADLAFRTRHLQRARTLYDRLGDRSSTLPSDEVARRRGELAEEAGDLVAARVAFAASAGYNPGNLAAQQALARVSMRLDDDRGAYNALRSVLELLPRDAHDRAAELRRHLGELAARLGELDDARVLLETVLGDDPHRRDVLALLTEVYERSGLYALAAELYARRALDAERNDERAELLFSRGEALVAAGDREGASDAYLKAADLNPRQAPTLRRLVRHYLAEGDLDALAEVIEELEVLAAPLGDASVEAALGLSLRGDEARGAILAALAQPTPAAVASALAVLPWPPTPTFEAALRTAMRALGGTSASREHLVPALEARVADGPGALPARLALAMLAAQAGLSGRARIELEILSFIAPTPLVEVALAALPSPALPEASAEQVVAVSARGPLRDVLSDLGPLVLGLAVAPLDVDVSSEAAACVGPVASLFGYATLDVALLDRLSDPAWAEPTRPPRLLLQRRFADDARVMRFAAARALHALHAGLGLIHGRSTEDIAALIRGAAALFLPDLRTDGPFVRAWQAELLAIGLRPELLPEPVRVRLEVSLANLLVDRTAAERAPAYADAERLTANRVAYAVTADLRAGLRALSPELPDAAARERYVLEDPVLIDLIAFARDLIG